MENQKHSKATELCEKLASYVKSFDEKYKTWKPFDSQVSEIIAEHNNDSHTVGVYFVFDGKKAKINADSFMEQNKISMSDLGYSS